MGVANSRLPPPPGGVDAVYGVPTNNINLQPPHDIIMAEKVKVDILNNYIGNSTITKPAKEF